MFTNYIQDPADVAARLAAARTGFAASGKSGSFEDNAVRVIAERLREHPERYVEFGPYWWALKRALIEAGQDLGDEGQPLLAAAYCGASVAETMVMAEAFKDFYRTTFFAGTQSFDLTGDGTMFELTDADMQARVGKP